MTGKEFKALVASAEFKQGLQELSSYLASVMQERPIVYLLAKVLWKNGYKFELEEKGTDLFINGKRIEFKFNYEYGQEHLTKNLDKCGGNLRNIPELLETGKLHKTWSILPKIYADVYGKKPDLFVWIVYSRDLTSVPEGELKRICRWREQLKYNAIKPYTSGGKLPEVFDRCVEQLHVVRPFSLVKHYIETNGDFPSTYHFRICDFAAEKHER